MLVACYAPSAPLGIPCASNRDCPGGQTCDELTSVCGLPTEARTWRDDTAADFGAAGAYTDEVTVEAAGFVGPAAYLVGGLRLTGIDRHAIANQTTTTWDELAAAAHTGTSLARGFDLDFSDVTPPGFGLSHPDDITVLLEGELDLNVAGSWRFELTANDLGFIEIARPGTDVFERVVTDEDTGTTGTYEVTTPGWHRIRGAFADASMVMSLELRSDPPDLPGNFRKIPADQMRAPAGDLAGVLVDGFENAFLIFPRASVVHPGTLGGLVLGNDPFGLLIGNSSLSLRFASQILIDAPGRYTFRIDSHQGHRAWIDGVSIADAFETSSRVSVTSAVQLEPGWHDLVVDVHKSSTSADLRLDLTVADGPAWAGQPVPADHLRPIVGRGTRWAAGAGTTNLAIPDQGSVVRSVTLELPPDMVPTRIDATIQVDHPLLSTLDLVLDPPVGSNLTFAAAGSLTGSGSHREHAVVPAADAGATWSFIANDIAADMMTGEEIESGVTMIGPGGIAPFPTRYRYVSAPRDLGDVAAFQAVHWALRQVRSDTVAGISMRTCDEAAACAAEPWTAVADGARPEVAPRRFAQYAIDLTSNGDVPTALDWIAIDYTARVDP